MASAVGVDWAGNGWVAAVIPERGAPSVEFYATVLNLWRAHGDAETILIDMPIGLRETGTRACALAAKRALSNRQGSVFLTPTREAVYAPNIQTAKERQRPADFSVQNQAWAIVPRIRELDGFLQEYADAVEPGQIREAHPELCFAGLNGGDPIPDSKGTVAGQNARLAALESVDPALVEAFETAVETLTEPAYAPTIAQSKTDDLLDALVLAATARLPAADLDRYPADPKRDPVLDRPIEIVAYPS